MVTGVKKDCNSDGTGDFKWVLQVCYKGVTWLCSVTGVTQNCYRVLERY